MPWARLSVRSGGAVHTARAPLHAPPHATTTPVLTPCPYAVHKDGSLSRITNWDKMGDVERANTMRLLCKRNRERLAVLRGEANNPSA